MDQDKKRIDKDDATPPLLRSADSTENDLTAHWEHSEDSPTARVREENIPGYEILETLGRGGMGVVYKARDLRLKRLVALKMILTGEYAGKEALARFHVEAETIARFTHTNIVQIYDVGEHQGRPYLTLELVEGGSLSQFAQGQTLSPLQAAKIVQSVARAAAYAHNKGVVHRDLKPANVLIDLAASEASTQDGLDDSEKKQPNDGTSLIETGTFTLTSAVQTGPIPKITDFGLAKQMDAASELTHSGAVLGTPSYMAPEQASGNMRSVGPAADIYSIGAILYWAVTNRAPFVGENVVQTISMVVNDEPVPPSRLQPRLPRDLETICLKCLEKQTSKRYLSADELADDLGRFLSGEPIHARAIGPIERTWKWVHRYPAVASIILLLAIAAPLFAWMWRTSALASEALDASNQKLGSAVIRAEDAEAEAVQQRDDARIREAELTFDKGLELCSSGRPDQGLHWLLQSIEASANVSPDLERAARANLKSWSPHIHSVSAILPHPYEVMTVKFAPNAEYFITGTHDGVRKWDLNTFQPMPRPVPGDIKVRGMAFSPDGARLLVTYADTIANPTSGGSSIWTLGDEPQELVLDVGPVVFAAAFSHDGLRAATGDENFTVRLWDAQTGKRFGSDLKTGYRDVRHIAFSQDNSRLLVVSNRHEGGSVQQWNLTSSAPEATDWRTQTKHRVLTAAFAPNDEYCATGASDGIVRFHATNVSGDARDDLVHRVGVVRHQFTPDGQTLVTTLSNGAMPIWDLATGEQSSELFTHFGSDRLDISSDGRWILAGCNDGYAHLWRMARPPTRPLKHSVKGTSYATSSTLLHPLTKFSTRHSKVLIAGTSRSGHAELLSTADSQPIGRLLQHASDTIRGIDMSTDGKLAAVGGYQSEAGVNGFVTFWDLESATEIATVQHSNYVSALAFSPNGNLVVAGDYHKTVRFWNPRTGEALGAPIQENDIIMSLAFRQDGKQLAIGTANDWSKAAHIQIWDVESRKPVSPPLPHRGRVHTIQFSPNGELLFSATDADPCLLWNVDNGQRVGQPIDTAQGFGAACFNAKGDTVYVGSGDGLVQCLRTTDASPVTAPLEHPHAVRALAAHPDGKFILVGCADGSAWLWDTLTHRKWGPPMVQSRGIIGVSFSEDGESCITVASDASVRRWSIPHPTRQPLSELRDDIERRTAMVLQRDSLRYLTPSQWLKRWPDAGKLDALRAIAPADLVWHEARARDAEQDGDPFAALWHLNRLIDADPSPLRFARRAEAHVLLRDFREGESDLKEAIRLGTPETINAWQRHRAVSLERVGRLDGALWHLDHAIAESPTDPFLFAQRAALRQQTQVAPAKVMEDLKLAVQHGAGTRVIVRHVNSAVANHRWMDARQSFDKALANGDLSIEDLAHGPLIYLKVDDKPAFEQLVSAISTRLQTDLAIASFLALSNPCLSHPREPGPSREFVALIQAKLDNSPNDVAQSTALTSLLGAAYFRSGEFKKALNHLNNAVSLHQTDGEFRDWVFLALAHHALGNAADASNWLDKANQASQEWETGFSWERLTNSMLLEECHSVFQSAAAKR